jgi:hypothetical protein
MFSDDAPLPDPSGSLEPPDRKPPTAIAVSSPPPPRPPRSFRAMLQSDPRTRKFVDDSIRVVFDAADNIADEIASLFRLRPKPGSSSPNLPAKIPPE